MVSSKDEEVHHCQDQQGCLDEIEFGMLEDDTIRSMYPKVRFIYEAIFPEHQDYQTGLSDTRLLRSAIRE